MSRIRNTLFELLKIELTPPIYEGINHYVPSTLVLKVQQQLREVDFVHVNQTGCCIIIKRDRLSSLYATNFWGPVEDVLGRRVCVEIEDADKISDADALVIILLAIIYSGFGTHKYNDDTVIMQWTEDGITIPQYQSYPCLLELVWYVNTLDLLPAIEEIEGKEHRQRIPEYLSLLKLIRQMDRNYLEPNPRPIYIEKEVGEYYCYGNPASDALEAVITRPIEVYSEGTELSKEMIVVLLLHEWSIDGAALDQPEPFGNLSNYLGLTAQTILEEIQRGGIHGALPSPYELKQLRLYQALGRAYDILSKHLPSQNRFKRYLDQCVDISSYRFETPEDVPLDERFQFFDKAVSSLRLPEGKKYNCVLMMIATAPSTPFVNGQERLKDLYRHIEHEGVRETAFFHGYIPFLGREENASAVLYIFTMIINN